MQYINMFDFFVNTYDTKKHRARSTGDFLATEDEEEEPQDFETSGECASHVDYLEESG